jgi:hypothetical protein
VHESLSDIHSCISLIEQAAGLPVHPSAAIADLTFQLCNIGGELVSVEGLVDNLGKAVNPGLLNEPGRWHSAEAWISLQRLIAQG